MRIELLQRTATALGVRVVGQLSGGAFGACHVQDATGADAVLKLLPAWPEFALEKVRAAAELAGRLRERGYPAPRFLAAGEVDGVVYSLQEYVAGSVPSGLTTTMAGELLQLWRTHAGAAPQPAGSQWGEAMLARIRAGEELRSASDDPRVLAVVDRALEVAAATDPGAFRTGDIVHGDFHPGNVLVRDGGIAAVFDWEQACAGDSRADLLRLYAATATWHEPDSPVVRLLRHEVDQAIPAEVWLPIGADTALLHLRYGLFARPDELEWVLREAGFLLGQVA